MTAADDTLMTAAYGEAGAAAGKTATTSVAAKFNRRRDGRYSHRAGQHGHVADVAYRADCAGINRYVARRNLDSAHYYIIC